MSDPRQKTTSQSQQIYNQYPIPVTKERPNFFAYLTNKKTQLLNENAFTHVCIVNTRFNACLSIFQYKAFAWPFCGIFPLFSRFK